MHGLRGVSKYRTIWISDTHLGTRGCKAEYLLDFLKHTQSEKLYLVGDIIDGWRLKRSWYWNDTQTAVIQEILRKTRQGTEVIYVPGNHDEVLRDYLGLMVGGVKVRDLVEHETGDGRRFLVIHGDQFDGVVRYAKWLALLGDWAYNLLLWMNDHFNKTRKLLGLPYWSLSAYLKHKVKNAVEFISCFEEAVAHEAKKRKADGVICGHIHHPEIRQIDGILYCNDGDWVESCTALVEQTDGRLEIIHWAETTAVVTSHQDAVTGRAPTSESAKTAAARAS
ncbi:UDP-2,3-diacylglucosamine diphosphatase [Hwanghaeella sp.]|uniref:UDP-2,3-diacylglucosamine diphosphatase n=1 Tax=Hwanghaeella sp. TaxID=2605943 RepID=UPI003CCBC70C